MAQELVAEVEHMLWQELLYPRALELHGHIYSTLIPFFRLFIRSLAPFWTVRALSKRKAAKLLARAKKKQCGGAAARSGVQPVEPPPAAPTITTRLGRTSTLPERYVRAKLVA
jgi:hypothetical protein